MATVIGFLIVAWLAKFFLGDYEYFKSIDWEANLIFGIQGASAIDEKFMREADILEERNKRQMNLESSGNKFSNEIEMGVI